MKLPTSFFVSTVGIACLFVIFNAFYASWKPREKFMDCSMSGSCVLPPPPPN